MDTGTRVRVIEPQPTYYVEAGWRRKIPNVMHLGKSGEITGASINNFGEPIWLVRLSCGTVQEFYEGELKDLTTPERSEQGTRELPDWANNPEEMETRLNRHMFLNEDIQEAFDGHFQSEDEVRMRIAELQGAEIHGESNDELPGIL